MKNLKTKPLARTMGDGFFVFISEVMGYLKNKKDDPQRIARLKVANAVIILILLLSAGISIHAATRTANTSGNWNSTTTWGGQAIPTSADDVIINSGITVTVNVSAQCSSLIFVAGSGGSITVNSGITLAVTNSLTLQNAANANVTANISGAGTLTCASLSLGDGTAPTSNNTTRTHTLTSTISTLNISGDLSINSYFASNNRIRNAAFVHTSGTVTVSGSIVTTNQNASNTSTYTLGNSSPVLNLRGGIPFNLATTGTNDIVLNGTGATVNYSYNGAQTVYPVDYTNLTLSAGGTKTLQSGTTTIAGNFTIDNATTTAVVPLTISGNVVLNNGYNFIAGSFTHNVTGNWTFNGSGTFTTTGSTINFTGNNSTINGTLANPTFNNITISKTAGQTLSVSGSPTTLNVNGNLVLQSGNFSPVTATTVISGNWTNNGGTLVSGSGAVTMKGSAKTIGGTTSTIFNNLTINNNAGGILLGANQTVNGTLTLSNGLLKIGSYNLTLGATAPAVAGVFNSTNMIIADGTGEVRKIFTTNGSYTFPIGDNSDGTANVSPITLNFVSGTYTTNAYAGVRVTDSKHPNNASTTNYLTRYWTVTQSGISTFSCNVNAKYESAADIVGQETLQYAGLYTSSLQWAIYSDLSSNTLTANGVTTFGDFTGIDKTPTITTSLSTLSAFNYPEGYGPSGEQSFTVSGSGLIDNIRITPTDNFEISTGTGTSFVASSLITLPVSGGRVSTKTIYVRMKAGHALGTIPEESIKLESSSATDKFVKCSGTVTTPPAITTSAISGTFSYTFGGGPSIERTFTVSGSNLVGDIIITPPTDYEISRTTVSGFVSTPLTLTQSGGSLSSTTIYIRLKTGLGTGTYSENVVASTTSAASKNIALSGTVSPAPTITTVPSYLGSFIYTYGSGPSGVQSFVVAGSTLNSNVTITAPANFEISTSSGTGFTNTLTLTPSGGNVNTTVYVRLAGGLAVGTYGTSNVSITSTGAVIKTVGLNGTVVNASTPTISTSKTSVTGFGYMQGTGPSSPQSFTVSGASLLSPNVTLTLSDATYEVSLSPTTGFQSAPITLSGTATNGTYKINPTIIYIRLKAGNSAGNYNKTITLASGTTTKTVSLVGVVFVSPLITAGGGGEYCAGSTVNLTSTGADIQNRYWQGPNNYYSTDQNPVISNSTTTMSGTYTVTGNVFVGGNLIYNGDFESGNTGFGSSYTYVSPAANALQPEAYYTVVNLPSAVHYDFTNYPDHTNGSGLQMVVNGAPTAGVVVWTQSVPVIPGATYQFSYSEQTVNITQNPKNASQLQLYVNGVAAGPVYTAPQGNYQWATFIYNAEAKSNTVLNLELINQNTVATGNDFALDDIIFQQILPATSSTTVTVNPIVPVSVSVTPSANPVYTNTPVTYTATPVNGGSNPTYQWKINNVVVSGATNSTFVYTPNNNDVVTCVLTSSLSCTTNNPASASVTMTVNPRSNFWMGSIDTDWAKPGNWTANFVPLTGDDVEYATTLNNKGNAAVRDLKLDMNRTIGSLINATTQRLLIPAGLGLTVNNTITTDGNPDRIYIYSSNTIANGSLIFHNLESNPVSATVEMYSKAHWDLSKPVNNKFSWQYFGIPIRSVKANPTFEGAFVRKWNEKGDSITNHWKQLQNDSLLYPFYGYEICQAAPKTIIFKGQLVNRNFNSGQMPITSTALFPGQHIFANPYTAAIDIKQLEFGTGTESSVYLYNTGTFSSWEVDGGNTSASNEGQYLVVPKGYAGSVGLPRQIPSMQGVLIKAMSPTNATFNINYNTTAMINSSTQRVARDDNEAQSKVTSTIDLIGTKYSDKMYLIEDPECTEHFDNGYDGYKILGTALTPQIYAIQPDGNFQVAATNNVNGTRIAFQAGIDSVYTLVFTNQNIKKYYKGLYLYDMIKNKTVDVTESGSFYKFEATSKPTAVERFKVFVNPYQNSEDNNKDISLFNYDNIVFVNNLSNIAGDLYIYDIAGRFLTKKPFGANSVTTIRLNVVTGAYVLKAVSSNVNISKRVIVR